MMQFMADNSLSLECATEAIKKLQTGILILDPVPPLYYACLAYEPPFFVLKFVVNRQHNISTFISQIPILAVTFMGF